MSREWKPGDVAMVSNGEDVAWRGIVRPRRAANDALEFAYVTGGFDMVGELAEGYAARPLLVIDPEDREQVERLAKAVWDRPPNEDGADAFQNALRSLLSPPTPEEPTRDGALIACELSGRPGRAVLLAGSWTFYGQHLRDHSAHWGDFDAVEVLSEGVTP